jgi:hypothetical protein
MASISPGMSARVFLAGCDACPAIAKAKPPGDLGAWGFLP